MVWRFGKLASMLASVGKDMRHENDACDRAGLFGRLGVQGAVLPAGVKGQSPLPLSPSPLAISIPRHMRAPGHTAGGGWFMLW